MLLLPDTKKEIINWIIACLIIPIVVLPVYFCSDFMLSNIFIIIGSLYIAYVALSLVTREGFFDLFSFQLSNLISSFRPGNHVRYPDAYEYKKMKEEKRKQGRFVWIPWVSVGVLMIILSIIFAIYPV
ncbi:MAG: DUF3899 domain-containing protein [Bacilli bacterium]